MRLRLAIAIVASLLLVIAGTSPVSAQKRTKPKLTGFQKNVTYLPTIDKVEILAERQEGNTLASKTLTGAEAQTTARLWRKLVQGNGMGCFAPAYVLKFYRGKVLVFSTRVCFHCCNITIRGEGDGIVSMCGNEKAVTAFEKFVTTTVPFPKK